MPTLHGSCIDCGKEVERYIRPGKPLRCFDCALNYALDYSRTLHDGTNPDIAKSYASGREVARQIKSRKGPIYARWRDGILHSLTAPSADEEPDAG